MASALESESLPVCGRAPELRERLGNYPELGKRAAGLIPGARLVEFPTLGHAPQMQDPDAFHQALLANLAPSH